MAPLSTTVRHLTKDHIVICPAKGYSVTTFNIGPAGGDVEAFVVSADGCESFRLLIAGPTEDQTMAIQTNSDGDVSIVYTRKEQD